MSSDRIARMLEQLDRDRESDRRSRLARQAAQAFDRGLRGRAAPATPTGQGEVYGGAAADIQVGSPPAGEWIHLTATGAHLAGARDVLTFDTVAGRSRFDSTPDAGTVVLPRTAIYEFELWFKWDAYLYGGEVEIEVDGTVVQTFPGETRVGREFEPWSSSFVANAGDQLRVLITLPDGTSATCDAKLVIAAVEPIKEIASDPPPDAALTPTVGSTVAPATMTVTLPAGVTEGDLLVVTAFSRPYYNVAGTWSGMDGWDVALDLNGIHDARMVYVKVADAADEAGATYSLTITLDGSSEIIDDHGWVCHAVSADGGTFLLGSILTDDTSGSAVPGTYPMETAVLAGGDYGLVVAMGYRTSTAGSRASYGTVLSPNVELSRTTVTGAGSGVGIAEVGEIGAGELVNYGVSGGTGVGNLVVVPVSA